jgi:hypothetical protein
MRSSTTMRRALFAQGAVLLAVAVTLLALAAVGSANHSTTERVSTGPLSDGGPYSATFGGASADGTRVFFETSEPLQLGDYDTAEDVYERAGGTTTRISTGPAGGNGDVSDATFEGASADGTRVFFKTAEALEAGDTDTTADIYERAGGTTTRISTGLGGGNGAFGASFIGASADGTRVFFGTGEPLEAGDTDTEWDIYERFGGATTRISTGPAGGNGGFSPVFKGASADGTRVFFETIESLEAGDTDAGCFGHACTDIYERSGGTTTRISTGPAGGNGAFPAYFGGASADGTRVFFGTAESLVTDDAESGTCFGQGCGDVYQRSGGTTTRISTGLGGGNGAFGAGFDGASADGTRVFFETAEALEAGDTDTTADIYERAGGTTTRISTGVGGGNGDKDVYFEDASADGTRVLFWTDEALEAGDTDILFDIYERFAGATTRISTGPTGGNGATTSYFKGASADGTRVFFHTGEALEPGDTDPDSCFQQGGCYDVYERFAGTTTRLTTGPAGGNGPFPAYFVGASTDGTRVFFVTSESLEAGDTDTGTDVYAAIVETASYPGYARPKGATPIRVPLVIAYESCQPASANRTHGPPLGHASCAPPVEQSDWVTTGTPDANGQPTQFIGSLRFDTLAGIPATPTDEADLKIAMDIKDVRRKDSLTDYVGEVAADTVLRITDRFNANAPGGGSDPATVVDIPLPIVAQCSETADATIGSTCATATTLDAIVPAAVKEGKRAIWEIGQLFVSDGGSDGEIATNPNTVFARQGIFVP